jgi:hypothetical protein
MPPGTRYKLAPRTSKGVSSYLATFVLIGVAIGGSAAVFGTSESYYSAAQSPAVSLADAEIRQGGGGAVESVTVYNAGSVPFSSFTIITTGISTSASYCYSLLNRVTQTTISSTCPTVSTNPSTVLFAVAVPPGSSVTALLILSGQVFSLGSTYQVAVTTSAGAQQSMGIVALPA